MVKVNFTIKIMEVYMMETGLIIKCMEKVFYITDLVNLLMTGKNIYLYYLKYY